MSNSPRYAIYYVPERKSALDRFGSQLLGYDAWSGEHLPFPADVTQTVADWGDLTADPRKYGFHATLKAPFALAEGQTERGLIDACAAFVETPRPVPVIRPVVDCISGFIAVIPAERSRQLEQLAADCVTGFDSFRAPLTEQDRARRNPDKLAPRQRDYLDRWGYPYVMDEFRFHMTLTGRLNETRRGGVLEMLRDRFSSVGLPSLAIDRIALFRQEDRDSRFCIVESWPLTAMRS